MTSIAQEDIEALMFMAESDVLDFKSEQYPFREGTDEQKAEIIKDVVAFANAWKSADAHILIGVQPHAGRRARVTGVETHLPDSDLQQLVNAKTNVPVAFEYIPAIVDERQIGVIRVRKDQHRPVFLQKPFGKLKPNVVYIRRGSSTDEAKPDEIARMGAVAAAARERPVVEIQWGDPESRTVLGDTVELVSRVLEEPIEDELQTEMRKVNDKIRGWRKPDREAVTAYRKECALLNRVGLCARNIGGVLAEDARVILRIPKVSELRVVEEPPIRPRGPLELPHFPNGRLESPYGVHDVGDEWEVVAKLGKIQPHATVWSEPFWIGTRVAHDLELVARIFGDNISTPIDVPLKLASASRRWLLGARETGEGGGAVGHSLR